MSPLEFYPEVELEEVNKGYQFAEFVPEGLLIGTSHTGEAIAMDLRDQSKTKFGYYFIPFMSLSWEDATYAGKSLNEIIRKFKEMTT